jgi:hypothetical protein
MISRIRGDSLDRRQVGAAGIGWEETGTWAFGKEKTRIGIPAVSGRPRLNGI